MTWPDNGNTLGQFTGSLVAMFAQNTFARRAILDNGGFQRVESSPRISEARTQMVEMFLKSRCDWMFMVDYDMAFAPNALQRLMDVANARSAPIVGGLCFGGARDGGRPQPTMWVMKDAGDGLSSPEIVWRWPRGAVLTIDATGGAFLVVHRCVFEKLAEHYPRPYPWFAETFLGTMPIGEDVTMCLRARAQGFPVRVHTGVEVAHVNLHSVGLADYERITLPDVVEDAEPIVKIAQRTADRRAGVAARARA